MFHQDAHETLFITTPLSLQAGVVTRYSIALHKPMRKGINTCHHLTHETHLFPSRNLPPFPPITPDAGSIMTDSTAAAQQSQPTPSSRQLSPTR